MLNSEVGHVFYSNGKQVPRDVTIYRCDRTPVHLYGAKLIRCEGKDDEVGTCVFDVPIYDDQPKQSSMEVHLDLAYALVWETQAGIWFTDHGLFLAYLPEACIQECDDAGDVEPAVKKWRDLLDFRVPREKAIEYLAEFGAWTDQELSNMTDNELAERCLWHACGQIVSDRKCVDSDVTHANWVGLVH